MPRSPGSWFIVMLWLVARSAAAAVVPVDTPAQLQAAIAAAQPGDEIVLADGNYTVNVNLTCATPGTAQLPIVVRSATPRGASIRFNALEGFRVSAAHWHFLDLDIEGICAVDSNCEHAFHLFGDADFVVIRGNAVRDFNAQIKSNGVSIDGSVRFPDDVLVEFNDFFDTRARNTSNPVTKIDVVGGRRWILRGNTIYDFQKDGGNFISYGAFLKGNSRDGVMERNLVICEREFSGGTRVGLSLGGGGTSPDPICEDGICTPEHQDGILRNNILVNCPDLGIYLNAAARSQVHHNILYNALNIDVRFADSTADLRNNLLKGSIRNRDGGTHTAAGNLSGIAEATFEQWFIDPANADFSLLDGTAIVDQGVSAPTVTDDFCGQPRNVGAPDRGAVEFGGPFTCLTTVGGGISVGSPDVVFADGFEGG